MSKNINLKDIFDRIDAFSESEKRDLLNYLRRRIDIIDKNIASQLLERNKSIYLVGKIKKMLGIKTYSSDREKNILQNVKSISAIAEIQASIEEVYKKIIEESRNLQMLDKDLSPLLEDNKNEGEDS